MAQATGAASKVLLGFQADATTVATDGFVMPVNKSNLKSNRNQITPATIRGNLNPTEPSDGNLSVSGGIDIPVDSIAMWYWLKAAFGAPTTTGAGSPFTHVFKAGDPLAPRPYFTIEHQFLDLAIPEYFLYTGCKINSMSLSMGADAELVATLNTVAISETPGISSFDAAPTTVTMSRLKNNQMTLKEGGSAIANAKTLDCTISWNCDTDQYVIGGGGSLGSVPDGVMTAEGNLSSLFQDMSLLTKAMNSTESSLEATFSASASSSLALKFPEIKYTRNSPGIEGPKGIVVNLPYGAYYDNAVEGTSVQATLINTEAHA
ncbi:MAG: hypothetical protein JEZ12_23540 [Desulfobacterium sp.]|nr:hypothetical protein [Desulfobacterium sp.]